VQGNRAGCQCCSNRARHLQKLHVQRKHCLAVILTVNYSTRSIRTDCRLLSSIAT
jgi:hypothetical protein